MKSYGLMPAKSRRSGSRLNRSMTLCGQDLEESNWAKSAWKIYGKCWKSAALRGHKIKVGVSVKALGWYRANNSGTVKVRGDLVSGWVIGEPLLGKGRPTVDVVRLNDRTLTVTVGSPLHEEDKD